MGRHCGMFGGFRCFDTKQTFLSYRRFIVALAWWEMAKSGQNNVGGLSFRRNGRSLSLDALLHIKTLLIVPVVTKVGLREPSCAIACQTRYFFTEFLHSNGCFRFRKSLFIGLGKVLSIRKHGAWRFSCHLEKIASRGSASFMFPCFMWFLRN